MKIKNLLLALFILCVLCTPASTQGIRKKIRFEKGKASATVSGTIEPYDGGDSYAGNVYTLSARRGQKLSLSATTTRGRIHVRVGAGKQEIVDRQSPVTLLAYKLENGNVTIAVENDGDKPATYKITVRVE